MHVAPNQHHRLHALHHRADVRWASVYIYIYIYVYISIDRFNHLDISIYFSCTPFTCPGPTFQGLRFEEGKIEDLIPATKGVEALGEGGGGGKRHTGDI